MPISPDRYEIHADDGRVILAMDATVALSLAKCASRDYDDDPVIITLGSLLRETATTEAACSQAAPLST